MAAPLVLLTWLSLAAVVELIAEVWLDGVKVATIDLYSPTAQGRRIVWARNGLALTLPMPRDGGLRYAPPALRLTT